MTEKLVPREPTNAMLHRAYQECDDFIDEHGDGEASNLDNCQWNDMMAAAWRAMFDTAKPTDALSILYGASVESCTQLRQRAETAESALAACRGERDALHEFLRDHCIYGPSDKLISSDFASTGCLHCGHNWKTGEPETHGGNCPCALASKEAAGETPGRCQGIDERCGEQCSYVAGHVGACTSLTGDEIVPFADGLRYCERHSDDHSQGPFGCRDCDALNASPPSVDPGVQTP